MRIMLIFSLCVLCNSAFADKLDNEFIRLHAQVNGFKTETKKIEAQYLSLLSQYKDAKNIGRIYYHLTDMYVQSGMTDPESAIKYAKKTMEYPIASFERIRIGHIVAGALIRQNAGQKGENLAGARRQIVLPLLEAIKYSLEIKLPDQKPQPTNKIQTFHNMTYIENPDESPEVKKAREEQIKKIDDDMKKQVDENAKNAEIKACLRNRKICEDTVVSIYSKEPYATEELRRIASEVLGDKDTVNKLVARVDANIKGKLDKKIR